ncbi:MAG: metallopeptidase family protein [Verrucomicrobia bacterium]|nr:metallopeptidase family protein [Verrucomicrobiota bacterium]
MNFATLSRWADEEVKALTKILPPDVRAAVQRCTISHEPRPGLNPMDDELEGDELGLFEGTCLLDEPTPEEIPRIRLFLENLWEWVEEDEQDYRDEVGTTLLHELGHYLGWDEDEVSERGLE